MTGTNGDHSGKVQFNDSSMVIVRGTRVNGNTCMEHEHEWSLTNATHFQCGWMKASVDAGTNTVSIVRAAGKL